MEQLDIRTQDLGYLEDRDKLGVSLTTFSERFSVRDKNLKLNIVY